MGTQPSYLEASWEEPLYRDLFVVDHLNREALFAYGQAMLPAFQAALEGAPSGLFCDSLEIDSRGLWSPALWDEFAARTGLSPRAILLTISIASSMFATTIESSWPG